MPTDSMFATVLLFMNSKSTKSVHTESENILTQLYNGINEDTFENVVLDVFRFQAKYVPTYRRFVELLSVNPQTITNWKEIPFLPISFFKTHSIFVEGHYPELTFTSSGTTGTETSKHMVVDHSIYEWSFTTGFKRYINTEDLAILALLPNYLEQGNSSLVYMMKGLMEAFPNQDSGFYLANHQELINTLEKREKEGLPTLLMGVTYALLDLLEIQSFKLNHTIIMETGGMKGRRKEMIKAQLHEQLMKGFGVDAIHSEYGMTELFSQAYSKGNNLFSCPPWMKVLMRDTTDPFSWVQNETTGGINVVDLANVYSCSFIATDDLGKYYPNGEFEVLGRYDHSGVRGCNLLIQ